MSARLQPHIIYVWNSLGLWHAQAFDEGSLDPSVVYTSTDRPDVLQQAGSDRSVDETIIIDDLPDKPFGTENFYMTRTFDQTGRQTWRERVVRYVLVSGV